MTEFAFTVTDPNGIHARPAGLFVKRMQDFKSGVTVVKTDSDSASSDPGSVRADGKKLLALMKLRVKCGNTIAVRAEGEDETAAIEAAREFLTANL
jgi:phosphotransferase system HPr (HPr) family protein